jgi:glyoxylase-like metal-dependent hydrolase (beta-lactamase superfamily II)
VPDVLSFSIGSARLTRVPYFDVGLPAGDLNLSPEAIAGAGDVAAPWLDPSDQPLVGVAVWVVESEGRVVVVDPCGAADPFIRTGPEAITHQDAVFAALEAAGFERESVDAVVLSHLDGIGMAAAATDDGGWEPAFPNAPVIVTEDELAFLEAPPFEVGGLGAFRDLVGQGAVEAVPDGYAVTGEVSMQQTGAHSPGHAVVRVESDGELALLMGHLAITPIHLVSGRCEGMHEDADAAVTVLDGVIDEAIARSALLIGPLWPAPGAVRVGAHREPKPA